jgi:hypothetical protein
MQDGNIGNAGGISQDGLEINLEQLSQVDSPVEPGSDPNNSQLNNVEVDPDFQGLPAAEAIARTMQRKHDKLFTEHQKIVQEYEKSAIFKEILNDLYESDDAFNAFISERKPELLQQRDIGESVKKRLAEKFGEGYEPEMTREEAERKGVGSKDWQFYRMQDTLWQELSKENSYGKFKTLKEYRESLVNKRKEEDGNIQLEIDEAKRKLQASDAEVDYARKWASNLKFQDILVVTRILRKLQKAPVIGNVPGSQPNQISPSRKDFLDSIR